MPHSGQEQQIAKYGAFNEVTLNRKSYNSNQIVLVVQGNNRIIVGMSTFMMYQQLMLQQNAFETVQIDWDKICQILNEIFINRPQKELDDLLKLVVGSHFNRELKGCQGGGISDLCTAMENLSGKLKNSNFSLLTGIFVKLF